MYKRFHECWEFVDEIPPDSRTAVVNSGWHDIEDAQEMIFFVTVGDIAASGTVNAKVQQASASAGTGAKDISGKAMTELSATDDNKTILITVHTQELDEGFPFLQLSITPADAAADVAGLILKGYNRYEPVPTGALDELVV